MSIAGGAPQLHATLILCQALLVGALLLAATAGLGALYLARREPPSGPKARARGLAYLAGVLLLCSALLALAIDLLTHGLIVRIDAWFGQWLFDRHRAWLDPWMMTFSALGDGLERTTGTIVVAAYLLWRRRRRAAAALAVVMIGAAVLTPVLKTVFHFVRPSRLYSGAEAFSFPSGHATSAMAFYGLLAWIVAQSLLGRRKLIPWVLGAAMVILTGLSRVYLGAHWLSDVLAGYALGAALALLGVALASKSHAHDPGGLDGAVIPGLVLAVATVLGPHAFHKAQRLYMPYLERPADQAVDPGHLGAPGTSPIIAPPGV